MKVAIIGSRRRDKEEDKLEVYNLVKSLNRNDIIVSGGCNGVDKWAENMAKKRKLKTKIFTPNFDGVRTRKDMINCYYKRNKQIAKYCDIIYAFVAKDRKGGTENTIKYGKEFGKKIILK